MRKRLKFAILCIALAAAHCQEPTFQGLSADEWARILVGPECDEEAASRLASGGKTAGPLFIKLLDHPTPSVRCIAMNIISSDPALITATEPRLLELLAAENDDPCLRAAAAAALASVRSPTPPLVRRTLMDLLLSPAHGAEHSDARHTALHALPDLDPLDEAAVLVCATMLYYPHDLLSGEVTQVLRRMGPTAHPATHALSAALLMALHAGDDWEAADLVHTIKATDPNLQTARSALLRAAQSPLPSAAAAATNALAE